MHINKKAWLDGTRIQETFIMWLFLLTVVISASWADYTGHRLVSINATSREDLVLLDSLGDSALFEGLDFWTDLSIYRPVEVRVTPKDFGRLQRILRDGRISYEVINENIQVMIENERKSMAKVPKSLYCNIYNTFCTFEQIEDWLSKTAFENPKQMKLTTMNRQSYEGRNMYQVKIAGDMNNPKPAIWIEAGTHAREWISVSSALVLIDKLLNPSDPDAIEMLSRYDWHIAPVHNPDGYVYTHVGERLWRKNRQDCNSRFYIGTDLNRNWDSNFGGAGSSQNCFSDTYRGTAAFSAPETAALRDAVLQTNDVTAFFSIHCYSQYMLIPYGYKTSKPKKYDELFRVAEEMMKQLETVDKRYFLSGTPPDILYVASGGAYDFFYDQNVPYSYTYELRPASGTTNGFLLSSEQIVDGTQEVFVSLLAFAKDTNLDTRPESAI